jgi:hypothetical protein
VWNQKGPTGARGPSNGYSRWHDPEVPATNLAAPRLLELPVPAGKFVTTATAIVRKAGAGVATITCLASPDNSPIAGGRRFESGYVHHSVRLACCAPQRPISLTSFAAREVGSLDEGVAVCRLTSSGSSRLWLGPCRPCRFVL